jgi:hypothetical protein
MQYLQDKLNSLYYEQIIKMSLLLNLTTIESLLQLEQDLNSICGSPIDTHEEMRRIFAIEIYNYLSGIPLESMVDNFITSNETNQIDYMESIRQACGR